MKSAIILATFVVTLLMFGCSEHPILNEGDSTAYFSVTPEDGDTNVSIETGVVLVFQKSVDKLTVERNAHLFSESDITDSSHYGGGMMGEWGMGLMMADSNMMNHLIENHSTHGNYSWNADSTECLFQPDSALNINMEYMFHVGEEMVRMMEDRMGSMDMMRGQGSGMMEGEMFYHFHTADDGN